MQELDDTDLVILQMLLEDARRTYNEIATAVDLSPPAVSDRINRLKERGIIHRFTIDINHELMNGGTNVLIILDTAPDDIPELERNLADNDHIDQYFVSADSSFYAFGEIPQEAPHEWISETFDSDLIRNINVKIVTNRERIPTIPARHEDGDVPPTNSDRLRRQGKYGISDE